MTSLHVKAFYEAETHPLKKRLWPGWKDLATPVKSSSVDSRDLEGGLWDDRIKQIQSWSRSRGMTWSPPMRQDYREGQIQIIT